MTYPTRLSGLRQALLFSVDDHHENNHEHEFALNLHLLVVCYISDMCQLEP